MDFSYVTIIQLIGGFVKTNTRFSSKKWRLQGSRGGSCRRGGGDWNSESVTRGIRIVVLVRRYKNLKPFLNKAADPLSIHRQHHTAEAPGQDKFSLEHRETLSYPHLLLQMQ